MQKLLILGFFSFFLAFSPQKAQAQQPADETELETEDGLDEEFSEEIQTEKAAPRAVLPEPQAGPVRRDFDPSSYERAVAGVDYSNDFEKPQKPQNAPSGLPNWDFGQVFKPIYWLFILAGVVLICWMIFNSVGGPSSRSLGQPLDVASLDGLEDRLHETDFGKLIRQAVENEQFSVAVRLYFLAVLKSLSQKNRIVWKKEKTNRDYLRELAATDFRSDFQSVALLFDRVWYGEEPLGRAAFEAEMKPAFEAFLIKIDRFSA